MSLPVLRIETVETPAQLREFVRFPLRIYSTDSPWVPPIWKEEMKRLDSARGDFFQHSDAQLYLARDADGEHSAVRWPEQRRRLVHLAAPERTRESKIAPSTRRAEQIHTQVYIHRE